MREICQVITTFSGFHLLRYPRALSASRLSPLTAVISNDIWNYCTDRYHSRMDSAVRQPLVVRDGRDAWVGRGEVTGRGKGSTTRLCVTNGLPCVHKYDFLFDNGTVHIRTLVLVVNAKMSSLIRRHLFIFIRMTTADYWPRWLCQKRLFSDFLFYYCTAMNGFVTIYLL